MDPALISIHEKVIKKTPRLPTKPFNQDPLHNLSVSDKQLFNQFGIGDREKPAFDFVHVAFEYHAGRNSSNIAVEDFANKITYKELDRQSNCLAASLRFRGIKPGSRICLLVERSILMVVGILGVLKAGGAYVPLDGNMISDKMLNLALKDSDSTLVLLQRKFVQRITEIPYLSLEDVIHETNIETHCVKPVDTSTTTDSAYITYTSETTGVPKVVDVMHKNVTNLVCTSPGNLRMAPGTRVSQLMNISFDMAAWEILGSMANGATLCLRGKTPKEWRAVMKTVDVVVATPSMLGPHPPDEYPHIKVVAVAGEPCPKKLAEKWSKSVSFYNCCGLTETTIVNTMHLHSPGKPLGIGGPIPNNTVYVLDEFLRPVKIGEMGVMWAGGAGIARVYLNEKEADRYQRDPFLDDGSIMFNTGDLGRWMPNGNLEHLGRVDQQVKVKGFRVELDKVAAAMENTPGIKFAIAMLIDAELWGFYVPSHVSAEDVKTATSKVQPHYAVPTNYVSLFSFPETVNGKVDKRALEKIAREQLEGAAVSIPTPALPTIRVTPPTEDFSPAIVHSQAPSIARLSEKSFPRQLLLPSSITSSFAAPINIPPTAVNRDLVPPVPQINPDFNSSAMTLVNVPLDGEPITKTRSATLISLPLEKEIKPSKLENQTSIWAGYEQDVLPDKAQEKWLRNLRHQMLYLYRRLFSIVFFLNLALVIWFAVRGATTMNIGNALIGNLTAAVLMRQDYVVDAFYAIFTSVPRSWPLWIRQNCAKVYHLGGLHSGAGVSGTMWLIYFTVKATAEYLRGQRISQATLCFTYAILIFLCMILIFVYPPNRKRAHDTFEATHRFLGWTSVFLEWGQVLLLTNDFKGTRTFSQALIHSATFWLVVIQTISLILPWLRLKKVPVRCEKLSNHAVRMYFDYVTPGAGSFIRLSDSPLLEWHSFATIPEPGKTGFSIVVSRAGDWTIKMISKPPTSIWKRGVPTYGVMRIAKMFNRIVLVATGSGIAPCTPAVLWKESPIRLLWTAPSVRETFGDKLVDQILDANPDAVIYDTRELGKPDMVKLTWRLVREFNAEAVIIISNQPLTEKVVYGMVSRGVPAFGAIWDS